MLALHDWQNFYILTGTAGATLIGLLFVAISIAGHFPERQARNYLRTFVNPILLYYFQILLIACLALMPLNNTALFASALLILGSLNSVLVFKILWRIRVLHSDDDIDSDHWIWHILLPLIVGLLFIGTAAGFFLALPYASLGLSIAELLCLAIGLHNSWALMIWLILHREAASTRESSIRQEEKVS